MGLFGFLLVGDHRAFCSPLEVERRWLQARDRIGAQVEVLLHRSLDLRGVRLDDGLPRRAMSIAALVGGMLACPWLCWCVGLLWCRRRCGSSGGRASRLPTTEDVAVRPL